MNISLAVVAVPRENKIFPSLGRATELRIGLLRDKLKSGAPTRAVDRVTKFPVLATAEEDEEARAGAFERWGIVVDSLTMAINCFNFEAKMGGSEVRLLGAFAVIIFWLATASADVLLDAAVLIFCR